MARVCGPRSLRIAYWMKQDRRQRISKGEIMPHWHFISRSRIHYGPFHKKKIAAGMALGSHWRKVQDGYYQNECDEIVITSNALAIYGKITIGK
jgi:hypothetical protein